MSERARAAVLAILFLAAFAAMAAWGAPDTWVGPDPRLPVPASP